MDVRVWPASGGSVFVCGSPFAEVSTVAWALAAHPAFWTSSESRFLYRLFGSRADLERPFLYDTYQACAEDGAWLRANDVSYPEFLGALGEGIGKLFQARAGHKRWVDNSPENALLLEELTHMFPDAYFVGLPQSPRTPIFIETARDGEVTEHRIGELTALCGLYTDRLMKMAAIAPDRVFLLEESELFANPEAALGDLLEFLGEESHPAVASTFANHLFRLGMPLQDARDVLARFEAPMTPA